MEAQQAVAVVRPFVSEKLADPIKSGSKVTVVQSLYQITQFIALERDEARNNERVIKRLDAFNDALGNLGFEGGTSAQREILLSECKLGPDNNILALAQVEIRTIVDDLTRQSRGSSSLIDLSGLGSEDEPPKDGGKSDHERPKDKKYDPDDDSGSDTGTWRDSLKNKPTDKFNSGPKSNDWKKSLDIGGFKESDGDDWKRSLGDDDEFDDEIARAAETEFDKQNKGDKHGYHRSLRDKLNAARSYLSMITGLKDKFNKDIIAVVCPS